MPQPVPSRADAVPVTSLEELNGSQRAAVALCLRSDLAFAWGPPGTGKTMTLGHVVEELYAHGERVLVTSTTNAAVDQALEKLAALGSFAPVLAAGEVVRVGRSEAPTFGVEARELSERRVVDGARVVLATLSALSVSPQLAAQRFDAVILEEAGMAVLPSVFHCACLARRRVVFVGDPRQLPPIVQSRDPSTRVEPWGEACSTSRRRIRMGVRSSRSWCTSTACTP